MIVVPSPHSLVGGKARIYAGPTPIWRGLTKSPQGFKSLPEHFRSRGHAQGNANAAKKKSDDCQGDEAQRRGNILDNMVCGCAYSQSW